MLPCRAGEGSPYQPGPEDGGNPGVQDALAEMLQIEVQRIRGKEEVLKELEKSKDGLRRIGDEVRLTPAPCVCNQRLGNI